MRRRRRVRAAGPFAVLCLILIITFSVSSVLAEEIEISNHCTAGNGMPYAVAKAKGYFKEVGVDITGIRGSAGGGTTIRNLLAGNLAYGEAAIDAVVLAILRGTDLRIVDQSTNYTTQAWLTMPESPVRSLRDIKGKRVGFTSPQSTSEAMNLLLLETLGFTTNDVKLVSTGGFGEGLTMLEHGGIDVMTAGEPLYSKSKGKYRVLGWVRDVLPPMAPDLGVATGKAMRERPDLIRGILAARRKAVEFINAQPMESAAAVANVCELPVDVMQSVFTNIVVNKPAKALPYWGTGKFDYEAMNRQVRSLRLSGLLKEDVDWSKMVDESFLPADLRSKR